MSRHLQLALSSRYYDRQGIRFSQHDAIRPHGTDYGYSPPRRMLAAVKEGMIHPKPPSYRKMDRDSALCKMPIEHCRNSTSRSAGEYGKLLPLQLRYQIDQMYYQLSIINSVKLKLSIANLRNISGNFLLLNWIKRVRVFLSISRLGFTSNFYIKPIFCLNTTKSTPCIYSVFSQLYRSLTTVLFPIKNNKPK